MKQKHLIVVGGGAAGIFTAINAARMSPGLRVTVLEKSSKLLSKVKISGGGRCNVTHHCFEIGEMVKNYPRGAQFVKKTFHHFSAKDTMQWFEERGVKLKTEPDGRIFPETDRSDTIIECFLREAHLYKLDIRMNAEVKRVKVHEDGEKLGSRFCISYFDGMDIEADYLCIAAGGYPKSVQYQWLSNLGLRILDPVPSLFTFNMPGNDITTLMGVSVREVIVRIAGTKLIEKGPLLITHWGMSGPAILRLSARGAGELAANQYRFTLLVNWIPSFTEQELRRQWPQWRQQYGANNIFQRNPFLLPSRLWQYLLQQSNINKFQRWSELRSCQQNSLIRYLTASTYEVKGKTTFKEEFVTCGGIDLAEVDPNTMQSKKYPGLFFSGEILNVDGVTGGFNFQHAWTSGWIAAKAIVKMVNE